MNITKSVSHGLRRPVLILLAVLFFSFAPSAFAGDFPRVVVFGDSLSDPGNHFIAFGTISLQPFAPIPDASYAIGGHHFSDGATWAELLTQNLHLPTSGSPALRAPGVFTNYAVGRARARAGAPVFPSFDLSTQVGLFLSDFGGHAPSASLYIVWIGANDLDDALNALARDPVQGATTAGLIIHEAITTVAQNIGVLYAFGARTFLMPNLPNLAITPAVRALGPDAQAAATLLTAIYDGALHATLDTLQAALPQIHFVRLDVNALFAQVLIAPGAAGLTNVTDSCLTFGIIGDAICSTRNRYLFWDGIHPTTVGHGILAEAARQALAAP